MTIINDLNNQLNKSKENNKKLKSQNDDLSGKMFIMSAPANQSELQKKIDDLKLELECEKECLEHFSDSHRDEVKLLNDKLTEKDVKIYELNEQIVKLQNTDTSSVSSDDSRSNMEKWGMTDNEKKNMMKFHNKLKEPN